MAGTFAFSSAGSRNPWLHCALERLRASPARTGTGSGLPGQWVTVATTLSPSCESALTLPSRNGAVSPTRIATRRPMLMPRDEVGGRFRRQAPSISSTTSQFSTV